MAMIRPRRSALYMPGANARALEKGKDVPADVLQPRNTWQDKSAYDSTAGDLRGRFEDNFKQFEPYVEESVKKVGIYKAA